MPFTVSITNSESTIYSQTVESLDLKAVINIINTPPPPEPPKKKRRSDAGKPRAPKPTAQTGGAA